MEKLDHTQNFIIKDDTKKKVHIYFKNSIDIIEMDCKKQKATGFLSKEKNLFEFINEIERQVTCPIKVYECYLENES